MSGKKEMPRYNEETKNKIIAEQKAGMNINGLSRAYGISRYSIQSWCGLRSEVELRRATPLPKGRPVTQPKTQEQVIRWLKMENELLRNFMSAVGRK